MSEPALDHDMTIASATLPDTCPSWCSIAHGVTEGEEDWVHVSEPLPLADGVRATLCMSVDPDTGAHDGPYVVIGSSEYTIPEAKALGASLIALSEVGAGSSRPAATGRRSGDL